MAGESCIGRRADSDTAVQDELRGMYLARPERSRRVRGVAGLLGFVFAASSAWACGGRQAFDLPSGR